MKTKKPHLKIHCKTPSFEKEMMKLEQKMMIYEELVMLRNRIIEGNMTDELYTFIDHHHGLESLFRGMPRPSETPSASLESVQTSQIFYIDAAIENVFQDIGKFLLEIWNKFCDWLMDWVDTNRRLKFRLIRHQRRIKASPMDYGGDPSHYAKIKGMVFNYRKQWVPMFNAVRKINDILKKVPANDPHKWYQDNFTDLADALAEFGIQLNTKGTGYQEVIQDNGAKHSKQETVVGDGGAGWTRSTLQQAINDTIDLLKNEEDARVQFNGVKRAFDRAISGDPDIKDVAALKRLLKICKKTKEFAAMIARAVNDVCNIVLNAS